MKKIATILALFFATESFSQKGIIKLNPIDGQGYLVLDKSNYEKIDYWTVSIIQRAYDSDGISYKEETIKETDLFGLDYFKVEQQFIDSKASYFLKVEGKSQSKEIIVSEGPIRLSNGDLPYFEACNWICNGITYAFNIKQQVHPNGGSSIFSLNRAYNYYDVTNPNAPIAIPFYQYMTDYTFFNSYCPSGDWGLFANSCQPNGVTIVGPLDANNFTYRDASNTILSGNVYGVMKTLGPWEGNFIQTPSQAFGNTVCTNDLSWAINLMNTTSNGNLFSSQGMPELACLPAFDADPSESIEFENQDCIDLLLDFEMGQDGDIYDLLLLMEECETGSGPVLWWGEWFNANINDLSKGDNGIVINRDNLYKENGEINFPDFKLEPGLYNIGITLKNGKYLPLIKELKTELSNSVDLADFLDATAFPVPIVNDNFDLKLNAAAKLKFDYILTDFSGNQLYKKNFVIQQDHEVIHNIKPKNEMPEGLLFNIFIFEDGSIKSFTTIKN